MEKFEEELGEQGWPVVVTGSSSGIGAATCRMLTDRGIRVVGIDRSPNAAAAWPTVIADLSDPESIARAATQLPARLNGLINVAGVPGTAPARVVVGVNLLGLRALSRALAPRIVAGGFILNLASAVADDWTERAGRLRDAALAADLDTVMTEFAAEIAEGSYRFSKESVRVWTQLQAAELLPRRVRVNSVSPGPVDTPILKDFKADHGVEKVENAGRITSRFGQPEDIARVLVFLASGDGEWINGSDVRVDGGLGAARFAQLAAAANDATANAATVASEQAGAR